MEQSLGGLPLSSAIVSSRSSSTNHQDRSRRQENVSNSLSRVSDRHFCPSRMLTCALPPTFTGASSLWARWLRCSQARAPATTPSSAPRSTNRASVDRPSVSFLSLSGDSTTITNDPELERLAAYLAAHRRQRSKQHQRGGATPAHTDAQLAALARIANERGVSVVEQLVLRELHHRHDAQEEGATSQAELHADKAVPHPQPAARSPPPATGNLEVSSEQGSQGEPQSVGDLCTLADETSALLLTPATENVRLSSLLERLGQSARAVLAHHDFQARQREARRTLLASLVRLAAVRLKTSEEGDGQQAADFASSAVHLGVELLQGMLTRGLLTSQDVVAASTQAQKPPLSRIDAARITLLRTATQALVRAAAHGRALLDVELEDRVLVRDALEQLAAFELSEDGAPQGDEVRRQNMATLFRAIDELLRARQMQSTSEDAAQTLEDLVSLFASLLLPQWSELRASSLTSDDTGLSTCDKVMRKLFQECIRGERIALATRLWRAAASQAWPALRAHEALVLARESATTSLDATGLILLARGTMRASSRDGFYDAMQWTQQVKDEWLVLLCQSRVSGRQTTAFARRMYAHLFNTDETYIPSVKVLLALVTASLPPQASSRDFAERITRDWRERSSRLKRDQGLSHPSLTALATCYSLLGDTSALSGVYTGMRRQGMTPDSRDLEVILAAFARAAPSTVTVEHVRQLVERGVEIKFEYLRAMLLAAVTRARLEAAELPQRDAKIRHKIDVSWIDKLARESLSARDYGDFAVLYHQQTGDFARGARKTRSGRDGVLSGLARGANGQIRPSALDAELRALVRRRALKAAAELYATARDAGLPVKNATQLELIRLATQVAPSSPRIVEWTMRAVGECLQASDSAKSWEAAYKCCIALGEHEAAGRVAARAKERDILLKALL